MKISEEYQQKIILRAIFEELLEIQFRVNKGLYKKSISSRLTTDNTFQVTIFHDGVKETLWNIDSLEKLEKFKAKHSYKD